MADAAGGGAADARPIRLGCLGAGGGPVVVADQALPIALEIEAGSGRVRGVFTWPLRTELRDRATAVSADGHSVGYESPGTVVLLDDNGRTTVLGQVTATSGAICADQRRWRCSGPSAIRASGPADAPASTTSWATRSGTCGPAPT